MERRLFERILWAILVAIVIGLVVILSGVRGVGGRGDQKALDRTLDRNLKYQAKISLIREIYAPVEALRQAGQMQSALLKLAEIEKNYPGEAHGLILKGEIQLELGSLDEAVVSFAAAVRQSSDYIEKESPLSRRSRIQQLVTDGLTRVGARLAAHPDNRSDRQTLKDLYYLQSRLAGGCE